jgi:cellulose synthase/poly-beta-1,6-N-acetylglucosamine synthase-like glycosyltransferase
MYTFLVLLAAVTLAIFLKTAIDIEIGKRRITRLDTVSPVDFSHASKVSVIIPACNEEMGIETALESVLAQDYPNLQVIVVNDRSCDQTGPILERMAADFPSLEVVKIGKLPDNWLGKNNALHTGAFQAAGEWLLFADADVVMEKSAIARAMRYVTDRDLDHLAVTPRAVVGGFLANAFLGGMALLFSMHTRQWKIRDPKAKEYIGIGAFNLVSARAYRAIGGHAAIAMRPDDDLKLGKLLKRRGFKADFVIGTALLSVEWYRSFGEMRQGLMKNMFSILDYNILRVILVCTAIFLLLVCPFIAVILTRGLSQWLNAAVVLTACIAYSANAAIVRINRWWCLTLPLCGIITIYLILRATLLTIRNGGIEWRGTHYSLKQLRANRL